jgi:hypothetical protein
MIANTFAGTFAFLPTLEPTQKAKEPASRTQPADKEGMN